MRLVSKIWMIITLLGTCACIQDYDIDFSTHDDLLTLNCELDPDENIKVLVAIPKMPNQGGDYFTPSDAVVQIFEDDILFDVLTFKANDTEHGVYVSEESPQPGKTYKITAQYKDLPRISATQTTVDEIKVEAIEFSKDLRALVPSDILSVRVIFTPNGKTERSFAVDNYIETRHQIIDESGEPVTIVSRFPVGYVDDKSGFWDYRGYWINKNNLSELNYQLKFSNMDSLPVEMLSSVKLCMRLEELTNDGYLYRFTYSKRRTDNYGEPNLVYSNIENGLGIFSAKSSLMRKFTIID